MAVEMHRGLDRSIGALGTWDNFCQGFTVIEERGSKCSRVVVQILTALGGTLAIGFSGGSIFFGTLALRAGIQDYQDDINPYVMGHFSEWSIQGCVTIGIYLQALQELSLLGTNNRVVKLYLDALRSAPHSDVRDSIYRRYIDFTFQKPVTYFITLPVLPKLPMMNPDPLSELGQDLLIKNDIEEIDRALLQGAFFPNLQKGWGYVSQKYGWKVKVATAALTSVYLFHIGNYAISIYSAAKQAIGDYEEGVNPNVGGHSLEWGAEMFAITNFAVYYLREIANVGRSMQVKELFKAKIDGAANNVKARLSSLMRSCISQIPDGWFFSIPKGGLHDD